MIGVPKSKDASIRVLPQLEGETIHLLHWLGAYPNAKQNWISIMQSYEAGTPKYFATRKSTSADLSAIHGDLPHQLEAAELSQPPSSSFTPSTPP